MHRAGQRCFELLALIGSPQLSFSKVFPAEQTSEQADVCLGGNTFEKDS